LRLSGMAGMLVAMHLLSTIAPGRVNRLWKILFPPVCVFCRAPVPLHHTCCTDCAGKIRVWPVHTCRLCGSILPPELVPGPCGRCLTKPPPQLRTFSLYTYAGPVRTAILAWKLEGRDAGVHWLMRAAQARLTTLFSPDDLLLPVPMPLSRMRKAGRHHAADLCRNICHVAGSRMDWRILRRAGARQRQSALGRSARWKNLRKAFRLNDDYRRKLDGRGRIWVVDDICTTGATLHYACRTLKSAGYSACAFSLARLPGKE